MQSPEKQMSQAKLLAVLFGLSAIKWRRFSAAFSHNLDGNGQR